MTADQRASRVAWDRLPKKCARVLCDRYSVIGLSMQTLRQRAGIIDRAQGRFAPVWADRWEEAFSAIQQGKDIPEECRAPAYGC